MELFATPWLAWLQNPFERPVSLRCKPEDLVWQDPVTGTWFCVEGRDYEEYLQAAKAWLRSREVGPQRWDRRLPFGEHPGGRVAGDSRAAVGTALPYPRPLTAEEAVKLAAGRGKRTDSSPESPLLRTRLSDFLYLRAALFFALFYREVRARWRDVRHRLFRDLRPVLDPFDAEALGAVEELLVSGRVPPYLEGRRFLFVKGGAVRIKRYYLETAGIQEIRGGSRLLDELNGERLFRWLETLGPERGWTPESVVYSGGGRTLLVLPLEARGPEGEPPELAMETLYARVTINAECAFVSEEVPVEAWTAGQFSYWMSRLETHIVERQMCRPPVFYSEPDDTPDLSRTLNYCNPEPYPAQDVPVQNRFCGLCRFRPAFRLIRRAEGDVPVCRPCYHRAVAGASKVKIDRQAEQILDEVRPFLGTKVHSVRPVVPNSLVDLGEQVALVYGDGNNLGQYVKQMDTPAKLRYFSDLIDSVTRAAACLTLVELLPDLRFEMIAMAGDDLFFVAPAEAALEGVPRIVERFERALTRYKPAESMVAAEETMTLSVGVALGANDQAFLRLFTTAEELLKSAKSAKKKEALPGGTIDYLYLQSDVPYAGRLEDYRSLQRSHTELSSKGEIRKHFYARPYTAGGFFQLLELIRSLDRLTGAGLVHHMCLAAEAMTALESDLYAKYLLFRDSVQQSRTEVIQLLNRVSSIDGKERSEGVLWWRKGEEYYSLWHDVLELWGILGVRKKLEERAVAFQGRGDVP
ncbi:MAG: hypothetical protein QJR06_08005 [Alicyclobacillaceae bacterium]|nr:hypothetical protein [Alicyclobacillaceae bacterium]